MQKIKKLTFLLCILKSLIEVMRKHQVTITQQHVSQQLIDISLLLYGENAFYTTNNETNKYSVIDGEKSVSNGLYTHVDGLYSETFIAHFGELMRWYNATTTSDIQHFKERMIDESIDLDFVHLVHVFLEDVRNIVKHEIKHNDHGHEFPFSRKNSVRSSLSQVNESQSSHSATNPSQDVLDCFSSSTNSTIQ